MAGRVFLKRVFSSGDTEKPGDATQDRTASCFRPEVSTWTRPQWEGSPQCKSHRPLSGPGLWYSSLGPVGLTSLVLKPPPQSLVASASVFVTAKSWLLAIVNKQHYSLSHQHRLLGDSCGSLGEGVGTECPAVASLEACWPGLQRSAQSLSETYRETTLPKSAAQGALGGSFGTCRIPGRGGGRIWLCYLTRGE